MIICYKNINKFNKIVRKVLKIYLKKQLKVVKYIKDKINIKIMMIS